jgi:peptide/nickel transport system substrate-binding protein
MPNRRAVLTSAAATAAVYPLYGVLAATPKNILVMAKAIDDVVTLDPGESYEFTSGEICGNTYRKLVVLDSKDSSKLIGDLAESWEVSRDGLNITVQIRKGVLFESGKPLTAEDAAFSLQRLVSREYWRRQRDDTHRNDSSRSSNGQRITAEL